MFKKRKKAALSMVAVLAVCAIGGTAYATWAWDETTKIATLDTATGVVEMAVSDAGSIKCLDGSLSLSLDQYKDKDKKSGDGITLSRVNSSSSDVLSATWTVSKDYYDYMTSSKFTAYVNFYVKTETLGQYVKLSGSDSTTVTCEDENHSHGEYTTYTYMASLGSLGEADVNDNSYDIVISLSTDTVLFSYQNKPDSYSTYQKMVKTVCGVTDVVERETYDLTAGSLVVEYIVVCNNIA